MNTQPDLGIKDPYALDEDQLAAAVDLLKEQKENVSEYWSDYLKEVQAFKTGDSVIGTTWQVIARSPRARSVQVEAILPDEGSTGWSDTWMVGARRRTPTAPTRGWTTSPARRPRPRSRSTSVRRRPTPRPATLTSDKYFCDTYHAEDAAYAEKIHYWTTPIEQCLDGRTDVKCTDYGDWTTAWTEIKG